MKNKEAGLFRKFKVERTLDPEGKHDGCRYFVLDPQHDPIAREVLRSYAEIANRLDARVFEGIDPGASIHG